LAVVACKDFLTESPTTSLDGSVVYADVISCKNAVTASYAQLTPTSYYGKSVSWDMQMPSVFITTGIDPTSNTGNNDAVKVANFTFSASTSIIGNDYSGIFKAISTFNDAIYGIENSPGINDQDGMSAYEVKKKITADLYFLRAVAYFDVVRYWRSTPMPLAPVKDPNDAALPKSSTYEMFQQIRMDFDTAYKYMPAKYGSGMWDQIPGRPLKWAAEVMQAKVYAAMATSQYYFDPLQPGVTGDPWTDADRAGFWQKSYDLCKDVYDKSEKGTGETGYGLRPNYSDLFRFRFVGTQESIYEVPFNGSQTGPNQWGVRTIPGGNSTNSVFTPAIYTPNLKNNTNTTQIRASKAIFWLAVERYSTASLTNKKKISLTIANTDPRILENYIFVGIPQSEDGKTKINMYPTDGVANTQNGCHPIFLKYCDPGIAEGSKGVNSCRCPWIVTRYADLLLMLAEAANETNKPVDEVLGYVNQVLDRARASQPYEQFYQRNGAAPNEPLKWDAGDYDTYEKRRDAIMLERMIELPYEGHEFFDIRRRGPGYFKKMLELANHYALDTSYGVKYDSLTNNSAGAGTGWGVAWNSALQRWEMQPGRTLTDRRISYPTDNRSVNSLLFMPIPSLALSANSKMNGEQNYGY